MSEYLVAVGLLMVALISVIGFALVLACLKEIARIARGGACRRPDHRGGP